MRTDRVRAGTAAALAWLWAMAALAVPPADRTARVDADGVMRWTDDGSEVAVFGVNYYTPFALDYRVLGELGCDRRETIRRDVAQFRRLGLTALRLHCFDREISTHEGALVDNDHLDLLDYLIAECASNGIYTVLTPIAAWGGGMWTTATAGFACSATMRELTSSQALWRVQARYEEEFARHVNRYTGRRYADDPAVLCFELINEPAYPKGTSGEQIAAFANTLLEGIRRSGTTKPVFYSATWNKSHACIPFLKTDGVTGVYYATGLRAGSALWGSQLPRVRESSLKADPMLGKMAKIVYEFDAADMTGAYMYPAMAAVFRAEGVQSATQFQYEATPLGDSNVSYTTHYLNLVYTPQKAISMVIAAEVFRRVPRGTPYVPDANEVVFPPFRVNARRNLSEMVTDTALYYTSTPVAAVPAPEKLERVWGCGTSSVAASSGSGAYFFDRVANGLWRLQVYPSVLPVADPYTGLPGVKTIVLGDPVTVRANLPDLGTDFAVFATDDGKSVARATGGAVTVPPGDYILTAEARPTPVRLAAARGADLPAYYAQKPVDPSGYKPWVTSPEAYAKELRETFRSRDEVNLLSQAVKLRAPNFKKKGFYQARRAVIFEALALAFPKAGPGAALVVQGRSTVGRGEPMELAMTMADGMVWGLNVTVPEFESEIRIPTSEFRHFAHWDHLPNPPKGVVPDLRQVTGFSFAIGDWLDVHANGLPHGLEITSVRMDD